MGCPLTCRRLVWEQVSNTTLAQKVSKLTCRCTPSFTWRDCLATVVNFGDGYSLSRLCHTDETSVLVMKLRTTLVLWNFCIMYIAGSNTSHETRQRYVVFLYVMNSKVSVEIESFSWYHIAGRRADFGERHGSCCGVVGRNRKKFIVSPICAIG